jgi:hypothetical protein
VAERGVRHGKVNLVEAEIHGRHEHGHAHPHSHPHSHDDAPPHGEPHRHLKPTR